MRRRFRSTVDIERERVTFRSKGFFAILEEFKACCAQLGRMDLYRAVAAQKLSMGNVALRAVRKIACRACRDPGYVSTLENYVAKRSGPSKSASLASAQRYVARARASARSIAAPGSSRAKAAQEVLALPDLFPDDRASIQEVTMAEPTQEQIAAAQAALAAMDPPRTDEDIAPNTLEAVVAVFWSQVPLIPAAQAAAQGGPMFCELLVPPTPELQAEVEQYNLTGTRLAARIHAANLQGVSP